MTANIVYTGELRTVCTHIQSGSKIETDAPTDNHGKGERFSPTDLVATALASCVLTTLGILGKPHNLDVEGAVCDVEKVMVSNPRRIGEIRLALSFPNGQIYTDKEKKLIEHISNTCPVYESLHPDMKKSITFNWAVAAAMN